MAKVSRPRERQANSPVGFCSEQSAVAGLIERSELLGRGPIESLRALGADADKDINLSVSVRWGLDGRLLWLS